MKPKPWKPHILVSMQGEVSVTFGSSVTEVHHIPSLIPSPLFWLEVLPYPTQAKLRARVTLTNLMCKPPSNRLIPINYTGSNILIQNGRKSMPLAYCSVSIGSLSSTPKNHWERGKITHTSNFRFKELGIHKPMPDFTDPLVTRTKGGGDHTSLESPQIMMRSHQLPSL